MVMKVRLHLADNMEDCPICWENFVWDCQSARSGAELRHFWPLSDEDFDQALAPYNARVYFNEDSNYVEFNTPEDKTFFLLKWS